MDIAFAKNIAVVHKLVIARESLFVEASKHFRSGKKIRSQ